MGANRPSCSARVGGTRGSTNQDNGSQRGQWDSGGRDAAPGGLQRAHLGPARVRQLGRRGGMGLAPLRGARRAGADGRAGGLLRGEDGSRRATRSWAWPARATAAGSSGSTAAIDDRVDVITPVVAWHSLLSSLYKGDVFKAGWGSLLCGLGSAGGTARGSSTRPACRPARWTSTCTRSARAGRSPPACPRTIRAGSPTGGRATTWMDRVRAPALVLHGTVDTLFTLQEAIDNFRVLRGQRRADSDDVVLRRPWHLPHLARRRALLRGRGAALARGVPEEREQVRNRPALRMARPERRLACGRGLPARGRRLPHGDRKRDAPARGRRCRELGHGHLGDAVARAAWTSRSRRRTAARTWSAPPRLVLDYRAQGMSPTARAYAQIVDADRDIVIGGQVTPIPLTLDHQAHTLEVTSSRSPTR